MRSAHCPLRLGHCPLRQRIVRMTHHTPSVWLVSRKKRATLLPAACPALSLSALRSQRRSQVCALSAALSSALSALRSQRCSQLQPLAPAPSDDDDRHTHLVRPGSASRRSTSPRGHKHAPSACGLAAISDSLSISLRASSAATPLRPRRCLCLSVRPRPRSQR